MLKHYNHLDRKQGRIINLKLRILDSQKFALIRKKEALNFGGYVDTKKILVVEDEQALREIIVSLLKENHHDVFEAKNGREALDLLSQHTFTLILSDIKMPVMDGLEFFTHSQLNFKHIPVVFITAFGDYENMLKALRLGAFDFIKKPFDDEEVIKVVDRALEIGYRKKQIIDEIENIDPKRKEKIDRHNKVISLIQINNDKKRASG